MRVLLLLTPEKDFKMKLRLVAAWSSNSFFAEVPLFFELQWVSDIIAVFSSENCSNCILDHRKNPYPSYSKHLLLYV